MAQRSAALFGPGRGPKIHVGREGRLRVRGLLLGETAMLTRYFAERTPAGHEVESHHIAEDGEFSFKECRYAQVEYGGDNRAFSAVIYLGAN